MTIPEILEALMLAAFSIGWYWSISVMFLTRRPYGKSGAFICCTIAGYALGLIAQLLEWQSGEAFNYLVILYGWNLSMTAVDLALVIYFSRQGHRSPMYLTNISEVQSAQNARNVDLIQDRDSREAGTPCSNATKTVT